MKAIISTATTYTAALTANDFRQREIQTTIFSTVPSSYFGPLHSDIELNFVPMPFAIIGKLLKLRLNKKFGYYDSVIYDYVATLRTRQCDIFFGRAHFSLRSGLRARQLGAKFVLDRACPHVDFQENLLRGETEKLGERYDGAPPWLIERQHLEYDAADWIVVPSHYSGNTFPGYLKNKVVVAPMYMRVQNSANIATSHNYKSSHDTFNVGIVGGDPVRKGYLYLLQAWNKLNIPNAKLKLKVSGSFHNYTALRDLLKNCKNVEFVGYVPDMSEFYSGCDLFVLPSVDDGFGMALLEAMSYGIPCIATTSCGASELFELSKEICVVPPQNSEALAEAIDSIYNNKDRAEMGIAGRRRVMEMSVDGVCQHYSSAINLIFEDFRTRNPSVV